MKRGHYANERQWVPLPYNSWRLVKSVSSAFVSIRGEVNSRGLHQGNDVLDAGGFAQQQIAILIDSVTPGDEGPERLRPAGEENAEVAYCTRERFAIGVDRADHDLILQHQIAHDDVGVNPNGRFGRRDAGEDVNAVQPQHAQDVVGNLRGADRFVNEIDIPDTLGELVHVFDLAGDVFCADGLEK